MSERCVVRVVARGRVQGVGFRAFVEDEAIARSLAGWVRNRRDGSVEAVVAGQAAQVEALVEAVRRGPPASRVDAVDVEESSEESLGPRVGGFATLPSV